MPIPRKYFELGIDQAIEGWMKNIHGYLSTQPQSAFSQDELIRNLGISRASKEQETVCLVALEKLAEVGVVEARRVKGVLYYALGRRPLDDVLGKS